MKTKGLAVLAGVAAPLIFTGAAHAGFVGLELQEKQNGFGVMVVNVYAVFDNPDGDLFNAVAGTPINPLFVEVQDGMFFSPQGGTDQAPSTFLVNLFPSLAFDTFVTIGVKQAGTNPQGPGIGVADALILTPTWPGFDASSLSLTNDGWAVTPDQPQALPFNPAYAAGDGRILIMQLSTPDGTAVSGDMLLQFTSDGVQAVQSYVSFSFPFTPPADDEVDLQVVVRSTPSPTDTSPILPDSDGSLGPAPETFVAELWARELDPQDGLVGVYANLWFPAADVQATSIEHRPPFNLFPEGVIDNSAGVIMDLGGTDDMFSCTAGSEWSRVAIVYFDVVETCAMASFPLSESFLEVSACGVGGINPAAINFGIGGVVTGFDCIYDIDNSGFIDAGDLGLFATCWATMEGDPKYVPECDFDCNGVVAAGDLGFFAAGWLALCSSLEETDLPDCRQCGFLPSGASQDGEVLIGWSVEGVGRDGVKAGDRLLVEVLARDQRTASEGLSAVFFDLEVDPEQVTVMNVDVHPSFGVFAGGVLHAGGVSRLGGATLTEGVALDDWVPVAVVQMQANVDLLGEPRIQVSPTFDGVSGYRQGTVPEDQLRFVPLDLAR